MIPIFSRSIIDACYFIPIKSENHEKEKKSKLARPRSDQEITWQWAAKQGML